MFAGDPTSLEIRYAILCQLKGKLNAAAISTGMVVRAVRQEFTRCPLTDRELTNVVAETAIEAGFAVNFEHIDPLTDYDNTGTKH